MTARTWSEGDPFPADRPPLVDDDGITWLWIADEFDGSGYQRQQLTTQRVEGAESGVVLGHVPEPRTEWPYMLAGYGPFREATAEEADHMTLTFKTIPARGGQS